MIVTFIDENRDELGVEPICTALQSASSTYYAAKNRPVSPRAARDAVMMPILMALWVTNRKVYGAHKLYKAARRAGHDIGRDQVARLMRRLGIRGVTRRRRVFTTRADPDAGARRGPGQPGLHRAAPERPLGDRSDLRADPVGDGVRVLHR